MIELIFKSIKVNDSGSRNSRKPVILLRTVCGKSCFFWRRPEKRSVIRMKAITAIQAQIQTGMRNTGSSWLHAVAVNIRSAAESNLEPKSLADPVFLATGPSIISVNPHNR